MYSSYVSSDKSHRESIYFLNKVYKNVCLSLDGKLLITFGSKLSQLYPCDIKRIIFETEAEPGVQSVFKNALLEMVDSCNRSYPGSDFFAVVSACCLNNKSSKKLNLRKLCKFSKRTNKSGLIDFISKTNSDDLTLSIIKYILNRGGFTSSLNIGTTPKWKSSLKFEAGYKFNAHLDFNFTISTGINKVECYGADIIVIDGLIESVSEIHHLLEHYSENKKSCFIVARKFADDIISTLAVNKKRKTLNCYPCVVPQELNTINSLKDISIVTGCNMVSSLKGEIISSIDREDIPQTDFIKISNKELVLKNHKTEEAVKNHVSNINKWKSKEHSRDKIKLLEGRVINLNPNVATVEIGQSHKEFGGILHDRILYGIGLANAISRNGLIDIRTIKDCGHEIEKIILFLKEYSLYKVPSISFLEGIKAGNFLINSVTQNGGFVLEDA